MYWLLGKLSLLSNLVKEIKLNIIIFIVPIVILNIHAINILFKKPRSLYSFKFKTTPLAILVFKRRPQYISLVKYAPLSH